MTSSYLGSLVVMWLQEKVYLGDLVFLFSCGGWWIGIIVGAEVVAMVDGGGGGERHKQ